MTPTLVRGLDYYTRTAFEFVSADLSAQHATLFGGGRYDGLAEVLGGPRVPGSGSGWASSGCCWRSRRRGSRRPRSRRWSFSRSGSGTPAAPARELVRDLRAAGVPADAAFEDRPLKAQLKMADRAGATYAAIVGERELETDVVTLRRLADGQQDDVPSEGGSSRGSRREAPT